MWSSVPNHGYVYAYIPINTPEMTLANPPIAEVEKACTAASKSAFNLVEVKRLGERFWIACFSPKGKGSKGRGRKMVNRDLSLGGQVCRFGYLPSDPPTAFMADFSGALSINSSDVMRAIHAAIPPKQALPELVEIISRAGKKKKRGPLTRHFQLHFARSPSMMRLYVPVGSSKSSRPFIGAFAPMDPGSPCVGCGKTHGTDICPTAQIVSWPMFKQADCP
jgi:hypothetical protein